MTTIAECFSKKAHDYDRFHQIHKQSMKDVLKLLDDQKLHFDSFLEVGCGTAELLCSIQKQYPQATLQGLDLSFEMIQIAQSKLEKAKFFHCDAIELTEHVDCLISHFSFQWMKPYDLYLQSFLKKARYVVLSVPLDESFSSWKQLYQQEGMKDALFHLPSFEDFEWAKHRIIQECVVDYPLLFSRPIDFAYYLKNLGAQYSDSPKGSLLKKKWFQPKDFETNYRVYHVIYKGDLL